MIRVSKTIWSPNEYVKPEPAYEMNVDVFMTHTRSTLI